MTDTLPSFEKPPVNEVVMGVQFDSLEGLLAPHLGKFWALVQSDYPSCSENPPIIPQIEDFGSQGAVRQGQISFELRPDLPRVFFEDLSGQWLIQIQRDRFLHNWRVARNGAEYPRYPEVSTRFFKQWERFRGFVTESNLGTIRINQLEITYLNRIPLASSKLSDAFPDFHWRDQKRFLSRPEAMNVSCSFKSEGTPKRLRATIKPAIQQDQHELLFELTVRGSLHAQELPIDWFAEGRAWIVKAFADLTSPEWHTKWKRVT